MADFQVGRQSELLLLSGRSDGCALHCVSLPNHLLIQDDGEHDVWVSVDATFVLNLEKRFIQLLLPEQ